MRSRGEIKRINQEKKRKNQENNLRDQIMKRKYGSGCRRDQKTWNRIGGHKVKMILSVENDMEDITFWNGDFTFYHNIMIKL